MNRTEKLHSSLNAWTYTGDNRMGEGHYTDQYFINTVAVLAHSDKNPLVTMQIFNKTGGVLAGVLEVLDIIRQNTAHVAVDTLLEGDKFEPWEPVMHIHGRYRSLAMLETPILGILARRTMVATNTKKVVEAAGGKPIVFMGARHDDWRVQAADGYAALLGGATSVSSPAGARWVGTTAVGTMPHGLIAAFAGDTVAATLAFARWVKQCSPSTPIISLVDFDNDVIGTSLKVAKAMYDEFGAGVLQSVRVDTSEHLVDRTLRPYLEDIMSRDEDMQVSGLRGVNVALVKKLRLALDAAEFRDVGIVVSGGFTVSKIRQFENMAAPVDAYGVGSSILKGNYDFTGDIIEVNEEPVSKEGREYRPNERLIRAWTADVGDYDVTAPRRDKGH